MMSIGCLEGQYFRKLTPFLNLICCTSTRCGAIGLALSSFDCSNYLAVVLFDTLLQGRRKLRALFEYKRSRLTNSSITPCSSASTAAVLVKAVKVYLVNIGTLIV